MHCFFYTKFNFNLPPWFLAVHTELKLGFVCISCNAPYAVPHPQYGGGVEHLSHEGAVSPGLGVGGAYACGQRAQRGQARGAGGHGRAGLRQDTRRAARAHPRGLAAHVRARHYVQQTGVCNTLE